MILPERVQLPVVLIGMPGAGKSRVGKRLATALAAVYLDTDELVVEQAGKAIDRIFAEDGEAEFRRLETEAIRTALFEAEVISLGGGAVETPAVRELISGATVVHIEAPIEELTRRVRRNQKRPLLAQDPVTRLRELAERRLPLYRELADVTVHSSAEPVGRVVDQVLGALLSARVVTVAADSPYRVVIGSELSRAVENEIPDQCERILLVTAPALTEAAERLAEHLRRTEREVWVEVLPDGEAAKTISTAEHLWHRAGEVHLGRKDLVVTLGGGATTDLGGFVGATWLRGVAVLHVPTTLLAMVDAAIGGKTGINTEAGKNLVGSFYHPIMVAADLEFLRTLPQADFTAGMGEVIKAGFIADPKILELVADHPQVREVAWATGPGRAVLEELIARAVQVKAQVVAADFTEAGLREILNYGHTLAHAIELDSDFRVRHGEAVAVGMMLAAQLAHRRGLIGEELVERHRQALGDVGLPTTYRGDLDRLIELMYSDKKTRGAQLRFVLLRALGEPETVAVTEDEVRQAAEGVIL